MFLISGSPCSAIKTLKAEQGRRDFSLPPIHSSHLYLWLSFFHFCTTAPIISGPDDFQYYVTTTEFTEEAILMRVEVSDPRLPWTLGNLRCLASPSLPVPMSMGKEKGRQGFPGWEGAKWEEEDRQERMEKREWSVKEEREQGAQRSSPGRRRAAESAPRMAEDCPAPVLCAFTALCNGR